MRRLAHILSAILLGGWILLAVPQGRGGGGVPLSQWRVVRAYDSAQECEKERDFLTTGIKNELLARPAPDGHQANPNIALSVANDSSKCVPAEHLYPTKPPDK